MILLEENLINMILLINELNIKISSTVHQRLKTDRMWLQSTILSTRRTIKCSQQSLLSFEDFNRFAMGL